MRQGRDEGRHVALYPRAPQQRARFIERRGAVLRHARGAAEEHLEREGIAANFDSALANAIFARSGPAHAGGVTP